MSNAAQSVETSGRTVDDAISEGLRLLGATRDEVDIKILEGGSKGFLGLGSREASVRISRKQRSDGDSQEADRGRRERSSGRSESSGRGRRSGTSSARGGRERDRESERSNDRGDRESDRDRDRESRRGGQRRGRSSGRDREPTQRTAADMLPPTLREEHFLPRSAQEISNRDDAAPRRGRRSGSDSDRRSARTEQQESQPEERNEPRTADESERSSRPPRERPPRERAPRERQVIEPDIDSDIVNLACQTLDDILRILEVEVEILIREPETPGEGLGSALAVIDLEGPNMGLIIGRGGETLTSIQYLVNVIVSRRHPGNAAPIFLDAAGYRKRREMEIVELAERMADRVKRTGRSITLEPMNAAERRIVHLTLADDPDLETSSTGTGESRKVQIHPVD